MTMPSGDRSVSGPLPAALASSATLRIAEARIEDIGHAIARETTCGDPLAVKVTMSPMPRW